MNSYQLAQQTKHRQQRFILNKKITNLSEQIERYERHIKFVQSMGGPATVVNYLPNGEERVPHPQYGNVSQTYILYFFYSKELPALKTQLQQNLDEEQSLINSKK
jgi:hypothetical protein